MDRGERLDAENRFIENPDDCLFVDGKPVYYVKGTNAARTLTRRLYELWYGHAPDPEFMLYPGPCGPACQNPRHRVLKGPSGPTG